MEAATDSSAKTDHVDVLIIGAGLSGIGAACHLVEACPQKSFAVIEAREAIGGTWDLFRYPGIRSDSDMFTLGYSFRPWKRAKAIADGGDIRTYVRETAEAYGVTDHIRFDRRATVAEWSSEEARWMVTLEHGDGSSSQVSCSFLYGCTGYYSYERGYTPDFPTLEQFEGRVVHPQHWPEDLDYSGQKVVVIGSGATAATLVPAMAEGAGHVTMLQRSPSYVVSLPAHDPIADAIRKLLPDRIAYPLIRWINVLLTLGFFKISQRFPGAVRRWIEGRVGKSLGADQAERHFSPSYDPWDQRVCLVPDGDLFDAINAGGASVVTGKIDYFTPDGIRLASGEELEADLIITATGLNLEALGGMELVVDDTAIELSETVSYKGMMLSGVPNMALTLGYTNASWTLKADLVATYICRLLNHMDANGYEVFTPRRPPDSQELKRFLELESGYVLRSIDELPKQGSEDPWQVHQNYIREVVKLRRGPIEDEGIVFSRTAGAPSPRYTDPEPVAGA